MSQEMGIRDWMRRHKYLTYFAALMVTLAGFVMIFLSAAVIFP